MAGIDYYLLEQQIRTVIDDNTAAKSVVIEEALVYNPDETPWVGIYLTRRDAPADGQSLSAGQRVRYEIRLSIWVYSFAFEIETACKDRVTMIASVEKELLTNRASITAAGAFWFEGGEFVTAQNEDNASFMAGGEIIMVVDATATV